MKEGPLKQAVEKDHGKEVLIQQFTTFKIKDNMLVRETITRRFDFFGDYFCLYFETFDKSIYRATWRVIIA